MNFLQAHEEFRRRCYAANLSPESVKQYDKVLKRFIRFCIQDKIGSGEEDIDISKITPSVIRYYLAIRSKEVSPVTVRIHYMGLHTFFSFLFKDNLIDSNPMARVEKPKKVIREIPAYSKEDINKLLNTFDKDTFVGYRNYTLTCLLFGTGMRRSEAANLRLGDIHFDLDVIKVIGKGDKFRNVPMGISLKSILLKYLKVRKKHIAAESISSSDFVFINSRTGQRLQSNAISDIYRMIAADQGINGVRVSPHTFRHTYAKFFLLNGGDVFSLQKILGHADIAVTKRYVTLNDKDIRTQNEKFNPLDNRKWDVN